MATTTKAATANDTTTKAHNVVDKAAQGAHRAVDKTADVSSRTADAVSEKAAELRRAEEKMLQDARGYVAKNPLLSVGIAAGAGFLLSRLFTSK